MSSESGLREQHIMARLQEQGQGQALRWLDELDPPARLRLLQQLASVDFEQLERFTGLLNAPAADIDLADVAPAPVERLPASDAERQSEEHFTALGRQALAEDRVAIVAVAGGQGTRLRYNHPKGMYPITPIRCQSLFEWFAGHIRAARRRHGARLPWLIMTGPTNDEETRRYFEAHDHFQLGADSVHFFIQQTAPILDAKGRLLRAEKDQLLVGPDGHGGTLEALAKSGLLELLEEEGWDLISYFQVDNPLVTVADPRFLGHHLDKGADMSCKVVPKCRPDEGLGIAALKAGSPAIIEYSDLPDVVAEERTPSGGLKFLYGSIAIHAIDVPFVRRTVQQDSLPWHIARKTYVVFGEDGRKVESPPKGCFKFEKFIFDALAHAQSCAFVEVERETEFAPVKNAEGVDSPGVARKMMQRMWLHWLREAGVAVEAPEDLSVPVIEISPMYASDEQELKARIEPGWTPSFPLVLDDPAANNF